MCLVHLTAKVSGPQNAGPLDRKATKKRWATKAAQRCKNDSWWRLLHKRWRPKRLESLWNRAERWNRWVRA